ncbi:hypothetical protein G3N94_22070 [Burkholderia sp. Ac-20353]|nr:hypothetical protein [Burkholderia sp. Ac-20353]MBN3789559.1 hypothetical protein [Burkholderia sp. Ac-20353]
MLTNIKETARHGDSRFWRSALVRRWIQGHGRNGFDFRLLLVPLAGIFVFEFTCLMFDMVVSAVVISCSMSIFLGVAGFLGAKREYLVSPGAGRAVIKARTKQAAERFSSIGAGATVLAIFLNATSVSLALNGQPLLHSVLKDAFSMFIALVFLPVYISGVVRKLAVARIEEFEALRNESVGTALKFDRKGGVRAVVLEGPGGRSNVSVMEYTTVGFDPPIDRIGHGQRTVGDQAAD